MPWDKVVPFCHLLRMFVSLGPVLVYAYAYVSTSLSKHQHCMGRGEAGDGTGFAGARGGVVRNVRVAV